MQNPGGSVFTEPAAAKTEARVGETAAEPERTSGPADRLCARGRLGLPIPGLTRSDAGRARGSSMAVALLLRLVGVQRLADEIGMNLVSLLLRQHVVEAAHALRQQGTADNHRFERVEIIDTVVEVPEIGNDVGTEGMTTRARPEEELLAGSDVVRR